MKQSAIPVIILFSLLLLNCSSSIITSFKQIQTSLERSNRVLNVSNVEKLKKIHGFGAAAVSKQADSIYTASKNLNDLIDEYKKQINNLDLTGFDTDIGYDVIANPDLIKGALMYATSALVKSRTEVKIEQTKQKRMDNLVHNMYQVYSDTTYFTRNYKGVHSANVLAQIAKMQVESSEIANISLESLYQSLTPAYALYMGGDMKLLMKYFTKEIIPILNKCISEPKDENLPTRLKMILDIDEQGTVRDVVFPEDNLSNVCKTRIREKILTMKGWSAPVVSGKPIKSKYTWHISCLMWDY